MAPMANGPTSGGAHPDNEHPEHPGLIVVTSEEGSDEPGGPAAYLPAGAVEQPAKVMRIGTMIKQLLDEVRRAPLDDAGRARLREIFDTSVRELAEGLSPELREELALFTLPFDDEAPTEAELRIAQAQLVGWLEGLFHGIQAALFAQQMAARAQLEELQRRGLPPGAAAPGQPPGPGYL